MIVTKEIEYKAGTAEKARGFLAYDDTLDVSSRPAVLIAHDWRGRSDFYCDRAKEIAKLGYIGFTIDMYGDATLGETTEEKTALLIPLKENRKELLARVQAGFDVLKTQEGVDPSQIAAMGYCFGGMCVLDLARAGNDLKGVVSFHGILEAPNIGPTDIKSKVLVLHAHHDSFVNPTQMLAFADEMVQGDVDWQIHIYGKAQHSFTLPHMDDPVLGLKYDETANARSWVATQNFFNELFDKV